MFDSGAAIPSGYAAEPARWEDLADVAALMAAVDRADYGEVVFGEDFVRGEWERSRFDLTTDSVLVRDAGGIAVAFAEAFDEDVPEVLEGFGVVHPEHRGRGLGSAIVTAQETRGRLQAARTGAPVRLHTAVAAPDVAAQPLLESRGFRPVRSFFHMEISTEDVGEPPPPPTGVGIRPYEQPGDDSVLHHVLMDSFRGQWGHHDLTLDAWKESQPGWMDPSLTFLATADDQVVACVIGSELGEEGWVSQLAVLPAWRGRGIGPFLLRSAFAAFRRRGYTRVLLNVDTDNEAGAVRVYERAGMHARRRWDLYEKEIEP